MRIFSVAKYSCSKNALWDSVGNVEIMTASQKTASKLSGFTTFFTPQWDISRGVLYHEFNS